MKMFVKNPIIPEGRIALVAIHGKIRLTIWYGPMVEVPTAEFETADEAHVGPESYDRLAERAAATGKGMTLQ